MKKLLTVLLSLTTLAYEQSSIKSTFRNPFFNSKGIWILVLSILFLISCEQTEPIAPSVESSYVSLSEDAFVDDGIVHFKTVQNYIDLIERGSMLNREKIVKKLDGIVNYRSNKEFYSMENFDPASRKSSAQIVELVKNNEFINTLVNSDGLLAIGDYYFKISLEEEKCYVLHAKFKNQLIDLISANVSNKNLLIFSIDDDVLDLLEAGVEGTINGRTQGLFCSEDGVEGAEDDRDFYVDERFRQNNRVTYFKFAVYFTLNAKTKTQYKSDLGLWVENASCNQYIQYYVNLKPKCRDWEFSTGFKDDDGCDNELNYRPYERARSLHSYVFNARFYGYDQLSGVYEISGNY